MANYSAGFTLGEAELLARLDKFEEQFTKWVTLAFDMTASSAEREMKLKAPWTDRTSAARNGLRARATHKGKGNQLEHNITLSHSVDYGIWLEVANSGKYAIVIPTIAAVGKEIMKTLEGCIDHLNSKPHPKVKVTPAQQQVKGSVKEAGKADRRRAGRAIRKAARQTRTSTTASTKRTRRT